MNLLRITAICVFALKSFGVRAQSSGADRLGKVNFRTSCSPQVRAEFQKGVALLHSFQYGASERSFADVVRQDPHCAIAYWGEAMSLYHQLWDWPSAESLKKGHEYIEKAIQLHARTEREREYISAAAAFYQDQADLEQSARLEAYSKTMAKLYQHYPKDDDATAFYALSLITLPVQGGESLVNRNTKALAILKQLFSKEPEHPGAAHYLIHVADIPELAPLGLDAARRYAKIAPASPHALHMPSHIFTRLGLWQDSIESNLASISAAENASKSHQDDGSDDQLHEMIYLEYSYLQSGRNEDALHVIEEIHRVPGASPNEVANHQAILEALYAVETHQWKQAAALIPQPDAYHYATLRTYWARAIGAARSGDVDDARQDISKLNGVREAMLAHMRKMGARTHMGQSLNFGQSVQQLEAEAWLAYAEGKSDEALEKMRTASTAEDSYSVDSLTVPAYEMLGDLLMELGQPQKALAAYQAALKEGPRRFDAVYGAARASEATGDTQKAKLFYSEFVELGGSSVSRKELQQAKLFLAAN